MWPRHRYVRCMHMHMHVPNLRACHSEYGLQQILWLIIHISTLVAIFKATCIQAFFLQAFHPKNHLSS